MNQRHGTDSIAYVDEFLAHQLVSQVIGLQTDQAGDDLEVVLYPNDGSPAAVPRGLGSNGT